MSIQDQITHLAGFFGSADLSNLQNLADLHTQFERIGEWAKNESPIPKLPEAIQKTADLIESIVFDEVPDVPASIRTIEQMVTLLQNLIREDAGNVEITFPSVYGLSTPPDGTVEDLSLQQKIERLSEEFVLADLSRPQILAEIHTRFQDIGEMVKDGHGPVLPEAVARTADLIERIVLNDVTDRDASLETVSRTLSVIQSICCENRPVNVEEFPSELGLSRPSEISTESDDGQTSVTLPPGIDQNMFGDFLVRQKGALEEIEELCLSLEKEDDSEKLKSLQRLLHTLKGEAGMLGLVDVERLCHSTEDMLKHIRPGLIADLLFDIKDWLIDIFDAFTGNNTRVQPAGRLLERIENTRKSGQAEQESPKPAMSGPVAPKPALPKTVVPEPVVSELLSLDVPPTPDLADMDLGLMSEFINEALEHLENADIHLLTIETDPENEEALNAVFRAFHTIKGVAGCLELNEIRALSHEAENLLDKARKGDLILVDRSIDATFASIDALKQMVNHLSDSLASGTVPSSYEPLAGLLASIHAVTSGRSTIEPPVLASTKKSIPDSDAITPFFSPQSVEETFPLEVEPEPSTAQHTAIPKPEKVIKEQKASGVASSSSPSSVSTPQAPVKIKEIVKVDASRLDHLVETIGELVIAVSMVMQVASHKTTNAQLMERHLRQLDKITRGLQGMGMSMRMIPVRATFQKMARLVRDLSRKIGKPIEFTMSGEDTELDKAVVDKIGDPLVHMVRNAVDHGIEGSPEERRKAGKSETGRIELRAFHKGGNIIIEIEDDGRGLNQDAILAKSKERGIVRDGDILSEREIYNLIFEPGFSTAKKVTEVSGRGVGMDVVRKNIEGLRGQVDIRSELGKGSIFTISLPLTLAIIDGMVVRVGLERYIIPTLSIVQSLQPKPENIKTVLNRGEMLTIQKRLIPIFRLSNLFALANAERDPTKALVVIVENNDQLAGLLVDELLGQQQIVIKSIGEVFREIPGVSGGAILSDGLVGLILDVGGLVRIANEDSLRNRVMYPETVQ